MAASDDRDEDREWAYSLEDLEDDADDDELQGSVAGSLSASEEIEPEDIDPEHALFVALGVVSTCVVLLLFALAMI